MAKAWQVGSEGSPVLLEQRTKGYGQGGWKEGRLGTRHCLVAWLACSVSNHLLLVSITRLLLFSFDGYSNPTLSHKLRLPFFPRSTYPPQSTQAPYLWIIPCSFPCCSTPKILLSDLFCILGKRQHACQWWAVLLLSPTPGGTVWINGMMFLNIVLICQIKKEKMSSEKWSHRDWAFEVSILRICG